jgi:hypothetical protein
MTRTAFIFAAFGLAFAAPAFASSHQSGIGVDVQDAPSMTASLSVSNAANGGHRAHSDFGMHSKLDQYTMRQDCLKQVNVLSGYKQNVCTVQKD